MLLLKCLLPWQLLVLPQIKHVHVVSEHQKQAENQEKVYWTNPWSWSLAFFLNCQQCYFLLCFHLRFKYNGKEDFAIRDANFSTTKAQSTGLCVGGDCGPYKWLTSVSSKLLDFLHFLKKLHTLPVIERHTKFNINILEKKYSGNSKSMRRKWNETSTGKKQERVM